MSDHRNLTREKLAHLIGETEQTLSELKQEMERRDEAAQHRELDRLEEHLDHAENGLRTVRDFFRLLTAELRKSGQS
ncbi:hypothetical protein SAMN05421538_105157 [Paracoccus isoporae]|uniref:Uncharacterized protein n=1 Tax=Paracoccus isoporae TaxID=591205 RepID=A0A1G7BNN5_9RHOB|nr:hypothetical protein [Paracoccus isoporae]SDE28771.1 hypothetical protein SAMN05421538_105157 [Paracoccus isoporae]